MNQRRTRPVELYVALVVAAVFHGGLLLAGSYRRTYDAYVHLFFADHYSRSWFSTWEPRWYTGFTTVSYPPGTHQLLAVTSRGVGLDDAFPVVALGAVLLLVVGVYRFSLLWVSPRSAGYAALLAALSSSIAESLHVFGQLPTLVSLAFLLNGLPFAHRFIRNGGLGAFAAALACAAATTAVHHVTTLFGVVFFAGPVAAHALLSRLRTPRADEPDAHAVRIRRGYVWPVFARRLRRVIPATARAALYLGGVLIALVVVVLPYWLWSSSDPITQIPIPHASRDNFIANPNAGLVFFLIPWGVLALIAPYALLRGLLGSSWPLAASLGLLALLGTGGTTPIPRLLLGGAFEVLTLDRFTFWATIAILPLAGRFVESLVHGRIAGVLRENLGRVLARCTQVGLAAALVAIALFSANLGRYRPLQPAAIDPTPIVQFLDKDQHLRWRYLTLGFGDQMAWVSAQTTAETVDGNYHSARRLPELTSTPVERLEGAKYSGVAGIGSLQQFLAYPGKYHLKFVFSNDHFYDPLLSSSGWQSLEPLENGIAVWQRDDVSPLPGGRLHTELPLWQRVMWGIVPLAAIASALLALALHGMGMTWPRRLRPRVPRLITGSWRRLDARLARPMARIPSEGEAPVWRTWNDGLRRRGRTLLAPVRARRRYVQVASLCVVVLLGAGLLVRRSAADVSPSATVYRYYDALDLRDLRGAYNLLDPSVRPTYEQFATERSVVNGLAASYARLERIDTQAVEIIGDRATVRADLVYLTALDDRLVRIDHQLRRTRGRWMVIPDLIDLSIPPDQLVVRPTIDYLGQGRRQVTTGTTAYQDVVDRPELQIPSARVVRHKGELSVVGEVVNVDVDPAYVTVTATLLGRDRSVLASYTSAVGAVHTALPGETIPFRVDFEGVAGLADPREAEFVPGARTPLGIELSDVAEVQVSAKALVTSLDLGRTLVAQGLRRSGSSIEAEVRNNGTVEITIPHVFVTLRAADGSVGWVDDRYMPEAIRPQRSQPLAITVTAAADVESLDIPTRTFANSLDAPRGRAGSTLLGSVGGWASADLTLVGFTRVVG